jgi:hypothetical protein
VDLPAIPGVAGHVSGIIGAADGALTANYIVPGVFDHAVARAVAAAVHACCPAAHAPAPGPGTA